ncbi:MAG: hypothetical protein IJK98_09460 [Clostridia bacterium]|nr:hypothetical protein [Clostridia bacterium]
MKTINKVICMILCLTMALSCFGFTVLAIGGDPSCEHNYEPQTPVPPTCADQGYTIYLCSKCGDYYMDNYTSALGHNYGSWTEVRAATCTREGLMERECSRCDGKETKTIPVTAHVDENEDGQCDVCGAKMEVKTIFSPFEWLKSFIAFLKDLIHGIFA